MKFNPDGTVTVATTTLVALASAVVHAQEGLSSQGHSVDWTAFDTMVQVAQPLLDDLDKMAMLPVRRDA